MALDWPAKPRVLKPQRAPGLLLKMPWGKLNLRLRLLAVA